MVSREVLQNILNYAINAPSGANSQPWSFRLINDDTLKITIHPEKDHPILNYQERGTLMALGALVENIRLTALYGGLRIQVEKYDRNTHSQNLRFERLEKLNISPTAEKWYTAIPQRCTNRKLYSSEVLPESTTTALAEAATTERVNFSSVTVETERKVVAKAFALFEQIMIENDAIRQTSFQEIIWPHKNERPNGSGLYIETLELGSPQQSALKLLKHPLFARFAQKIGLPKTVARDTGALYASGPLIGFLTTDNSDDSFIAAGHALERVWLEATAQGLSLQPLTGTFFLKYFGDANPTFFSTAHQDAINQAFATIQSAAVPHDPQQVLAMAFRIGHSEPPSRTSRKATPVIH